MATEFLYEHLRIGRGAASLWEVFKYTAEENPLGSYGRWVRSVEVCLPVTDDDDHGLTAGDDDLGSCGPVTVLDILGQCPNVEMLFRSIPRRDGPVRIWPGGNGHAMGFVPSLLYQASFPNLKSITWLQLENYDDVTLMYRVLEKAHGLLYLSLDMAAQIFPMAYSSYLTLYSLTTLHLQSVNHLTFMQMGQWYFPALTHLIIDQGLESPSFYSLRGFIQSVGRGLRVLELGQHADSLGEGDRISSILSHCPALEELSFFIFVTSPPRPGISHPSLVRIRLHSALPFYFIQPGFLDSWEHIERHFTAFLGLGLGHITLHGDWDSIVAHARFYPLYRGVRDSGCSIEFADGTLLDLDEN